MSGPYEVSYSSSADRELTRIGKKNPQAEEEIDQAVQALADDPRPAGVRAMEAPFKGCLRIDVRGKWGSFRVVYEVHDDELVVLVVKVGDRKDVYRLR